MAVSIFLNGVSRELRGSMTLSELVKVIGSNDETIAVGRNGEVVPRCDLATVEVRDGDRIEIVHFTAGG